MKRGEGFLEIQVGGRRYGLRLRDVHEVADFTEVYTVPKQLGAMRGLTALRGRLTPLIHLGALLERGVVPEASGRTAVLATLGGQRVALEVDEVNTVRRDPVLPVPEGYTLPWASGVVRLGDELVPVVDLGALRNRLVPHLTEDRG